MNVADLATALLFLQLPLTFWAVLHGKPEARALFPFVATDRSLQAAMLSAPLQLPCMALSVLIAFTGLESKKWVRDADSIAEYTPGDAIVGDALFWLTVACFSVIKTFLLMHYVDVFALILITLLGTIALFVSCRPVDTETLCWRMTGIVTFVVALILILALAFEFAKATETYIVAMGVLADGLLVVGHTWDYPHCSLSTVVNCRAAYVTAMQVVLPCAVCASCELL